MNDRTWMRSALTLAKRRLGQTWPNPAVGAVLVKNGIVIGRGATAVGGRPHAEVVAIAQATQLGHDINGATAYVTLEPCAHHGRTPPCADALISAGIFRLVCATRDTDPRVSGRGFERLRNAGIAVEVGLLEKEARQINAGFFMATEHQRPHILLKLATTLDGQIATRTSESRWITGSDARRMVHLMRAQSDGIMIGSTTAKIDDPALDVRDIGLSDRSPVRLVLDRTLSLPTHGNLARSASARPLWVFHDQSASSDKAAALRALGAILIGTSQDQDGRLSLSAVLEQARQRGLTRVMCEGGGQLAAALLKERLVDQLALFVSGKIIGGDGTPCVASFGLDRLVDAPGFKISRTTAIGEDVMLLCSPKES